MEEEKCESSHSSDSNLTWRQKFHNFIVILLRKKVKRDDQLLDAIESKVPEFLVMSLWVLAKIAFAAVLVAFCTISYLSDQQQKYLSLDNDTGSSSSYGFCKSVPYAVTGSWRLDYYGNWEGSTSFQQTNAYYTFKLSSFTKSLDEYSTFMSKVKSGISSMTAGGSSRSIAYNLIHWTNWAYYLNDGKHTQKVYLTGDAAYLFDRMFKSATVSTSKSDCDSVPTVTYLRATGQVTVAFNYEKYTTSLTCCPFGASKCILDPTSAGYKPDRNPTTFDLKYNIYSLATAFAVNNGIFPYEMLSVANNNVFTDNTKYPVPGGEDVYQITARLDSRYPGMDAIYCVVPVTRTQSESYYPFQRVCLVKVSDYFVSAQKFY